MSIVHLPVPYKVLIRAKSSKSTSADKLSGCSVEQFEIREFERQDVLVVGHWRQRWARESSIDGPVVGDGTAVDWKEQMTADPSKSRLILIDGHFYSPLRIVQKGSKDRPYLVTPDNLRAALELNYEFWTMSGPGFNFFTGNSVYQGGMSSSKFLESGGQQVIPDIKGKRIVEDFRDNVKQEMVRHLAATAVIDGVIWGRIAEPVIVVGQRETNTYVYLGERSRFSPSDRYFSLLDFEHARQFVEDNLSHTNVIWHLQDVQIEIPEALTASIEPDEAIRSASYIVDRLGHQLKNLTKRAGTHWIEIRDALEKQGGEKSDLKTVEVMVRAMQGLADALAMEQGTNADEYLIAAIRRHALETVDRWDMKPTSMGIVQ